MPRNALGVGLALLVSSPGWIHTLWARCFANSSTIDGSVHALSELNHRETAPFPTDVFTVTDQPRTPDAGESPLPCRYDS
jgi:hypothetical protein